jgi:hypothetical protein
MNTYAIPLSCVPRVPTLGEQFAALVNCAGVFLQAKTTLPQKASMRSRVYEVISSRVADSAPDIAAVCGITTKQAQVALTDLRYDGLIESRPGRTGSGYTRYRLPERGNHHE